MKEQLIGKNVRIFGSGKVNARKDDYYGKVLEIKGNEALISWNPRPRAKGLAKTTWFPIRTSKSGHPYVAWE